MGARGPKKTPTAKLLERGSRRGKARASQGEPQLQVAAPPCPEWLSDRARAYWQDVCDIGLAMQVITNSDRLGMALLCDALADWIDAAQVVDEKGSTAVSSSGAIYQHPMVGVKNKAWARVAKMLSAFGMTPADRASVKTAGKKPDNPLREMLQRRQG